MKKYAAKFLSIFQTIIKELRLKELTRLFLFHTITDANDQYIEKERSQIVKTV